MKSGHKIRICRVIARLNIGGPAIHVLNLSSGLDRDTFETMLLTGVVGPNEREMGYLAKGLGVKPVVIPGMGRDISPFRDVKSLLSLWHIMRQYKPHVVHTHTAKAGTLGRVAAALAGVPVIVHTFHGHVFHNYFPPLKSRCFRAIERVLSLLTTRIIAVSPQQREEIGGLIGAQRKMEDIRLGFDLSKFLAPREKKMARKNLGLPGDKWIVGAVGRLAPVKNLVLFIDIAERLSKERSDILFVVVGDGEDRQKLERLVRDKGLVDRVLFLGWQTDIERVYKAIDLLVLTSKNEGTPVAVIEAMASGCPVVAAPVGGVADLVKHDVTGLLAGPEDVDDFVNRVEQVLDKPERRQRLVAKARDFATSYYGLDRLLDDMSRLYINLVRVRA
ncbi:MAG: glycosyltransferase family 4 protein, partial [Deltaproteobacteria bacterium]|nr:glycosyltransferase family 4 protein [Deltaproteobacteria bacterium]